MKKAGNKGWCLITGIIFGVGLNGVGFSQVRVSPPEPPPAPEKIVPTAPVAPPPIPVPATAPAPKPVQAPAPPEAPYPQVVLPGEELDESTPEPTKISTTAAAPPAVVRPAPASSSPDDQQTSSSIAVTMPVPKLPYNMPRTRSAQERYDAEVNRSLQDARLKREAMKRAGMQYQSNQNPGTRQEMLEWSHPEKTLKVAVDTGEGRGAEGSTPVGQLLGVNPDDVRPVADATSLSGANQTPTGPPTASATPVAAPNAQSIAPAIPMPEAGNASNAPIPAPSQMIANAGGVPEPFVAPPSPVLPEGVQAAPETVPATPEPVAAPEKKKGIFGRIFGKRDKKPKEDPGMMPPPYISTGPQTGGAPPVVAPGPNAEAQAAAATAGTETAGQVQYVIVKNEAGTQFVIAGDTANGQSGILVPKGTVLQLVGRNGDWTTVKSPNGTIGSVQALDIRAANFDESIQFISSAQ